jgi:5-methyltetrahydrofolate--homocysteine methyltransferase
MVFNLTQALQNGPILCDGAMGTQIQQARLPAAVCPEEYNVIQGDAIEAIHRAYVEAGSDIILTNTFGCSRFKLRRANVDPGRSEEFIAAGCELARRAAGDRVAVGGDIGPSGEVMEPFGETPAAELRADFARQARAFVAGGVDMIFIETVMDLGEMKMALEGVREETDLPVVTSLSFGENGRTTFGNAVEECAEVLSGLGASVLGANCMVSIDSYPQIVRAYRAVSDLPIIAQPNAGQPKPVGGEIVYEETPEIMASKLPGLIDAGASVVGGCCGTTPETIRRFREKLRELARE